jgi:aminoglycoside 9-adenylyltransferase
LPEWGRFASEVVRDVLAADLRGLYLFGSAITGGLRPSSDVDLLALVTTPAEAGVYRDLARRLLAVSSWCPRTRTGRPIELTVLGLADLVPWRYPLRKQLQFGEWLRPELERGEIASPSEDPDVTIILATVHTRSVALQGPPLAHLIDPVPADDLRRAMAESLPQVRRSFSGDERNVILTLARMWVTLSSGDIVPKDEAAARMLGHIDPAHRPTLDLARRAYLGELEDDWGPREQAARAFVEYAGDEIRRLLDFES